MQWLSLPTLFLGPSGSGKLTAARKLIETAYSGKITLPLESRTFTVGDGYEARVLASPYHFEIDIPNLSMQDKQIIGDLLTMFFASGDVLSGMRSSTRKLVILRRAHALSLHAAVRVRAILQQYVLPPDTPGIVWMTAREITGPLALLEDAFVRYKVPRMTYSAWSSLSIPTPLKTEEAWDRCEGRPERVRDILQFFPDGTIPAWPRRISDFYDALILAIIAHAQSGTAPNLGTVAWIRGRIYQALGFCQTGPDIIDSCAAALQRNYTKLDEPVFWKSMSTLTLAEPHTSYRTALSLEAALLHLYETIRTNSVSRPVAIPPPITNELRYDASIAPTGSDPAPPPTTVAAVAPKRRVANRKS